jgi:hypothetical protein
MSERRSQPNFDQDWGREPDIGKEDRLGNAAVGRRGTVGSEGRSEAWEGGDVGENESPSNITDRKP